MERPASGVFQVDLGGIVDLLSRHLYTSPEVFLRELLQNAIDAIAARRSADPGADATIRIVPGDLSRTGELEVHDSGVGLTATEITEFLATVGRSSKRDELGFARSDFLGQFGIGLLSCFMVADTIEVVTRSAHGGPTMRWLGHADGTYTIAQADVERSEPGTTVRLRPASGRAELLASRSVERLARAYGELLPVSLEVETAAGPTRVTRTPVWEEPGHSPATRRAALGTLSEQTFGFAPLATIDLDVPLSGVRGVAFVMPTSANPSARPGHRVYLKRMLLSRAMPDVLPDWAFFVRCVLDTTGLRPTASREAFYDDDVMVGTREALGAAIRGWLRRIAASEPDTMRRFLEAHHLGLKAMALHDDGLLEVVRDWLPFETPDGWSTLAELTRRHGEVRRASSVAEFRQMAAIAAARGIGLVNAGYAYDNEVLDRLGDLPGATPIEILDPAELAANLDEVPIGDRGAADRLSTIAARSLVGLSCSVLVRVFDPATLAALYVVDPEAGRARQLDETRSLVDPFWSDLLGELTAPTPTRTPQLVLNWRNPLVRRLADASDEVVELGTATLYGQALLAGHHPFRPVDTAAVNRGLLALLDWAVRDPGSSAI